jgi:lipopolysaccharide heptosyltransferase III
MASVLERVPHDGRVLVIRLRSLGDCVLSTPALALLKQCRPDLRLAVVVENNFRAVFEGNPDIETLLPPEAAAVRRWRPHLTLNLHGGSRSAVLTAASGAKWRAGFAHFRNSFVYNVRIPTAQAILQVHRKVHTCEHVASAVFYLGVPMAEIPRARLFADPVPSGQYAVLHPAASRPDKTWPAARFLAVARHIEEDFGLQPIFIGARGDDLSPFHRYRTLAGSALASVKSLIARAMLFVGNDSGPAHMAAAFSVPSVVMFGASDPVIWAPWRTTAEVLTHPGGIAAISTNDVLTALGRMRVHV